MLNTFSAYILLQEGARLDYNNVCAHGSQYVCAAFLGAREESSLE